MALGGETIQSWHRLLRFPGLRLRTHVESVIGVGRWRSILADSGAVETRALIRRAVRRWIDGLDPSDPSRRTKRESAESLLACLDRLGQEIDALAVEAPLPAHAAGWLRFLRTWLIPSPDRARIERTLAGWAAGTGPTFDLTTARALLDEALAGQQVLRGSLSDRSIRVLPPMELLAGDFDLVVVAQVAEGRFPAKRAEDVLLTDELALLLGEKTGRHLCTSHERADLERRRFAAAVGSARRSLCLFAPASEFMTGRPVRPGRLLLDVAGVLLGRRARYEDLHRLMIPAGRRARSTPAAPADAIGAVEHLLARIQADPAAQLPYLAAHPIAWRLLRLQRSVDRFCRSLAEGTPYLDEWTGRITPAAVRCAISGDGPGSVARFSEATLRPGSFFFKRILRAWPAPRLRRRYDPAEKYTLRRTVRRALLDAITAGGDLSSAFDQAWEDRLTEALLDQPELEPALLKIARALGRRMFAQLADLHPDLADAAMVEVPATSIHDLIPWDVEAGQLVVAGDVAIEMVDQAIKRKKVQADDGFALALLGLGLKRAGVGITSAERIDVDGKRTTGDLTTIQEEVLGLARRAHARARLGFWPIFGAGAFTLAAEGAIEWDPLDTEMLDRLQEALAE